MRIKQNTCNSLEINTLKLISEYLKQKGYRPVLFDSELFPMLFFADETNGIVHMVRIDVIGESVLPKIEKREFYVHHGVLYWHNFDRHAYLKRDVKIHQSTECDKYFSVGWSTLGKFSESDYNSMIDSFHSRFGDIISLSIEQVVLCNEQNDAATDTVNHIGVCFENPALAIYDYLLQEQWDGHLHGV